MADEAKIKVRLETKGAKGDLKDLTKSVKRTGKRIRTGYRATVGRGLGIVGLGGGIGLGAAALRGPTSSGFGDVISEAFGHLGAQLSRELLGDLPEKAASARAAREETIQAFGYQAGLMNGGKGGIPPGSRSYFDNIRHHHEIEERGRRLFAEDPNFTGPKFDAILKKIVAAIGQLLKDAVAELVRQLGG